MQPRLAGAGGGGGTALPNGAPHWAQVRAMAGFSAPQLESALGQRDLVHDPPREGPTGLQVGAQAEVVDIRQLEHPPSIEHRAVHGVPGVVGHQLLDLARPREAPPADATGKRRHRVAARQERIARVLPTPELGLDEQLVAVDDQRGEPRPVRPVDAHGGGSGGQRGHRPRLMGPPNLRSWGCRSASRAAPRRPCRRCGRSGRCAATRSRCRDALGRSASPA